MKNTISVSQIGSFQDCQYKWQLMYVENIRTRKGDLTASATGSVVHAGMAGGLNALYKMQKTHRKISDKTAWKRIETAVREAIIGWSEENHTADKMTTQIMEDEHIVVLPDENYHVEWDAMITDAFVITMRTLRNLDIVQRYVVVETTHEGITSPLIEYWLEIDLSLDLGLPKNTYSFAGVVDAVLYDRETGATAVFDWKLHARFTDLEDEQLSSQIALYQHALRVNYGVEAALGIVYQIKRDPPRKPSLNMDGTMSRRQITSDWPTYEAALIEAGLKPDDYAEEMQAKLAKAEFYRPLMVFRTPQITQIFWDNLLTFARTIIKTDRYPMALGFSCRRCAFAALCNARIYGLDTEALFEDRYEYLPETKSVIIEELEDNIGE